MWMRIACLLLDGAWSLLQILRLFSLAWIWATVQLIRQPTVMSEWRVGYAGGEGYVGAGGLDGLCLCYGSITAGYLSTLKVVHAWTMNEAIICKDPHRRLIQSFYNSRMKTNYIRINNSCICSLDLHISVHKGIPTPLHVHAFIHMQQLSWDNTCILYSSSSNSMPVQESKPLSAHG